MTSRAAALLLFVGCAATLDAQASRGSTREPPVDTAPSRADSLLGRGRLRAAEDALYAAVAAAPRASAPRGALGRYLASRGRFPIAQVLYEEAQRFGADPGIVARAIAQMAPYRPPTERGIPIASGAGVTLPFTFDENGRTLGRFAATGRKGASITVVLDPRITGIVVRAFADSLLDARRPARAPRTAQLKIGERIFAGLELTADTGVAPGEARVGLDLLWRHGFSFDERAGTITLGSTGVRSGGTLTYVPVVLTFPGALLVPRPGPIPLPIEGTRGRDLLRGTRWWLDVAQGAFVVER